MENRNLISVGDRIRIAREKAGLTQQELAGKIDKTSMTLRSYEKNKTSPTVEALEKIAGVLGVEVETLLFG